MVYNTSRFINTTTVLILLSLLLFIQTTIVTSYPNGAGGCAGGIAAVNGTHLGGDGRPVSNNTLLAGGVNVLIGNTTLDTNVPIDISISTDHTITIISTQFPIRGILIRVQAPDGVDTTNVLTPGVLLQDAAACVAPIVGTTHIDSTDKTEVSSIIRFDVSVDSVILDITGVFLNSIEGSVYVYSRYLVNFVSDVAPTSPSPTSTPIGAETAVPTKTPTIAPTTSPTGSPVMAETASPTASPVITKTTAPTSGPVPIQTDTPTTSPVGTSPAPTSMVPSMTLVPSQPSEETASPIATPTMITSIEPSLRGGMGKGMMMSKDITTPPPTTKSPKFGKGMGMGMMMTPKGTDKVKQEKEVMKKSKIEDDLIDKKYSMMKLSKEDQ